MENLDLGQRTERQYLGVATPAEPRGEKTFFCANFGR